LTTTPELQIGIGDLVSAPLLSPGGDPLVGIRAPSIVSISHYEWLDVPGETTVVVKGDFFGGQEEDGDIRVEIGEEDCKWTFFNKTHIDCVFIAIDLSTGGGSRVNHG
jgi:IPT/TIG domain.